MQQQSLHSFSQQEPHDNISQTSQQGKLNFIRYYTIPDESEFKCHFTFKKIHMPRKQPLEQFFTKLRKIVSSHGVASVIQLANVYANQIVDIDVGMTYDKEAIQIINEGVEFKFQDKEGNEVLVKPIISQVFRMYLLEGPKEYQRQQKREISESVSMDRQSDRESQIDNERDKYRDGEEDRHRQKDKFRERQRDRQRDRQPDMSKHKQREQLRDKSRQQHSERERHSQRERHKQRQRSQQRSKQRSKQRSRQKFRDRNRERDYQRRQQRRQQPNRQRDMSHHSDSMPTIPLRIIGVPKQYGIQQLIQAFRKHSRQQFYVRPQDIYQNQQSGMFFYQVFVPERTADIILDAGLSVRGIPLLILQKKDISLKSQVSQYQIRVNSHRQKCFAKHIYNLFRKIGSIINLFDFNNAGNNFLITFSKRRFVHAAVNRQYDGLKVVAIDKNQTFRLQRISIKSVFYSYVRSDE